MTTTNTAPYGTWKSPITAAVAAAAANRITGLALDGKDLYWIEQRASEGGRNVIVKYSAGEETDILPAPFNARTRVHEYGGGALTVFAGTVYFSNFSDQRIYRIGTDGSIEPLTEPGDLRYADGVIDAKRNRLICVLEDHTDETSEAKASIVAVNLAGGEPPVVLVEGADFYAAPRISPDGDKLAWIMWNHPNMPWDGTELWVGSLDAEGHVVRSERIAGGTEESVQQPQWSPEGVLHFISDKTGWWNLYRWKLWYNEPLCETEAEFGRPLWVFGISTYGFDAEDRILCLFSEKGFWKLGIIDTVIGKLKTLETPYIELGPQMFALHGRAFIQVGSASHPMTIIEVDLASRMLTELEVGTPSTIDRTYYSQPEQIEFPTENGVTAYGWYYAPANIEYEAPEDELPPLLVKCHGGPTSAATKSLSLSIQYWTSRGFAVLDVDYGGSTGYGREYRTRLNGNWGIVDVDDCVNGARYLVEKGLADGNRIAIDGGSAGGFTTLSALTFRDAFKAGASHYGVSDLAALAKETHKFESRYDHSLIGPPSELEHLYAERSPINHTDQLKVPIILFQGLEDKVVPPSQTESIYEAVKVKGIPVAYVPFEGEQHGFRRAENITRALEGEYYFICRIFGIAPADTIEPIPIMNLD